MMKIAEYEEIVPLPKDAVVPTDAGTIINVLNKPVRHVAVIFSEQGAVRGNHWHPEDDQYLYIVFGRMVSHSRPARDPSVPTRQLLVSAGQLLHSPPGTAHAYWFEMQTMMIALTIDSREPSRFTEHTIREEILPP